MLNLITDQLPQSVIIGGAEYPIDTDFRTSMMFELLLQNDEISNSEKIEKILDLYFHSCIPFDLTEAVRRIIWFYQCGKEPENDEDEDEDDEEDGETNPAPPMEEPVYSFDYDAPYLYAAFLQIYQIDLTEVEYLHWWKFRALMKALPDTCEFCKIVGYRSIKITADMTDSQRSFYNRMKQVHALPKSEKEVSRHKQLVKLLKEGGDPTSLLST